MRLPDIKNLYAIDDTLTMASGKDGAGIPRLHVLPVLKGLHCRQAERMDLFLSPIPCGKRGVHISGALHTFLRKE